MKDTLTIAELEIGDLFVTGPGRHLYVRVGQSATDGIVACKEAVSGEAVNIASLRECSRPVADDFRRAAIRASSCWSREEILAAA